ncbi:CHAT domain-containing protein [Amycolatopsis sp. A133]|uniref:CHAT domain-containing protein n=1 Tax=Amycolatopsis sp. A133 TaxID=3064472 RepID=UPI0027EDEBBB|nr:CHAT domain-containing protein [Amycolatopsis sp. A133]MDQ7804707.1 CHAT domain-containing protein [Amycolatopsis sp. A133]
MVASPKVEDRVRDLHRRAVAATNDGQPVVGGRLIRSAARLLGLPATKPPPGWPAWPDLATRVLGTYAAVETALGNSARGLALLDEADALVSDAGRGILRQQRGLVLILIGRMDEALVCFDEAIPLLQQAGEFVVLARTLLNRAMLHQYAGRVRLALADLDQCEQIGAGHPEEEGLARIFAKAAHGRGQARVLTGDIPGALRDFDAASGFYAEQSVGMLPVLAVDKARALLAAGLPHEAAAELDAALEQFPRLRMNQEHAEAELTRALAALASGDPAAARGWAGRAERRFRRRSNETWAAVAQLTVLRADFAAGRRIARVSAEATALADRLTGLGLRNDAEIAALLAARARIALGDLDGARAGIAPRDRRTAPLENRLVRRLALAELGAASGHRRVTFANARAGLTQLERHRSRFGSVDLQTGTTSLGKELADAGLSAALAQRSPGVVFRWLDRSRAQAFRFRPVRPPSHPETVDAVAELRFLSMQIRAGELAGKPDVQAVKRCAALEREIRAKGWQAEGAAVDHSEAKLREIGDELAATGSAMVCFLADRGALCAQVIANHRVALIELGPASAVAEPVARLHSDLDALCGRQLPPQLDRVIRRSVRTQVTALDAILLAPLAPRLGDLDVVVVPTGALSAIPWGLLPTLHGRPVTVTPSSSAWLDAGRRARRATGAPLLVAGSDLTHAEAEVARLAPLYPDAEVLTGPDATVAATLKAFDGCRLAHFAAHGHHERENVLFSRLNLADGPLMAYDVQQLATAPEQVVLSSCDVGQAVVRAGDEVLGFTAALLYGGSRTVVSSVARVDDRTAGGVMLAFHQALAVGTPPARALADAAKAEPLMPFVCFGRS